MPSLKVLVCSGNLGNAKPNLKSLNAWIPNDGDCQLVLQDQPYPIERTEVADEIEDDAPVKREDSATQFDVIVVGIQESTFEVPPNTSTDGEMDLMDVDGTMKTKQPVGDCSNHYQADTQTTKASRNKAYLSKPLRLLKKVGKTTQKVKSLVASRDHTDTTIATEVIPDGTNVLHEMIAQRLPSYKRILSFQRGEMRLIIYALGSNAAKHSVQVQSVRAQNTGLAGLANKGGILAEVLVNEGTILSFVSCHLEAHEGIDKFATRCSTVGDILKGTRRPASPPIYPDASLASHFCFVLGDLNFRTRYNGHIHYEDQIDDVKKLVEDRNWTDLNASDELHRALRKHNCLFGFQTLPCNFPPTFKLERAEGYVYKENRTPSYTDRILWTTGDMLEKNITPLCYEPIDQFDTSDHKPIRGAFDVQLNNHLRLRGRQSGRSSVLPWRHAEKGPRHKSLHLFVGDIQCDIFPNGNPPPDSYLCLVSNPTDILLGPPTLWQRCATSLKKTLKLIPNYHDEDIGWPRTPVMKRNSNPDWGDKEIHCNLRTHHSDGTPINLAGAILHIFLFKYSARQSDEVIGSYSINLEHLFRLSAKKSRAPQDDTGHWNGSIRCSSNALHRKQENVMMSMDIDGPLLRNGLQTAVLRCTVDAWWVDEALAIAGRMSSLEGDSFERMEQTNYNQGIIQNLWKRCKTDSR